MNQVIRGYLQKDLRCLKISKHNWFPFTEPRFKASCDKQLLCRIKATPWIDWTDIGTRKLQRVFRSWFIWIFGSHCFHCFFSFMFWNAIEGSSHTHSIIFRSNHHCLMFIRVHIIGISCTKVLSVSKIWQQSLHRSNNIMVCKQQQQQQQQVAK